MPSKSRFAQLTSWSFSVYTQYVKCPFSVYLDKIKHVKIWEPDNPVLVRGRRSHEMAQTYISAPGKKRPPLVEKKLVQPVGATEKIPVTIDLRPIEGQLADLRMRKAKTEQEWAFDRQWNPVSWRDWDNAWLRIKTDVCADTVKPPTVDIVDWKTGKVHDEHKQQRTLYALGGLRLVQIGALAGGSKDVKLTTQHIYMDTGQSATENFTMRNLEPLKREWLARIKNMMNDTAFPTKPGNHCRWCKFAKSRGGPCPEKM